jgi:hypothetical protein
MGLQARRTIAERYAAEVWAPRVYSILEATANRRAEREATWLA